MYGEFPGSPDHDYFIVDAKTWDKVKDILFPKYLDPEYDIHDLRLSEKATKESEMR